MSWARTLAGVGSMLSLMLTLVVSLAASGPPARAQQPTDPDTAFATANAAYLAGDNEAAAGSYRALVDAGVDHPAVWHNLGNAYYRSGELGRAVHAYRRASKLDGEGPLVEQLRQNLEVVRRALQARYRAEMDGAQVLYADGEGLLHRITHVLGGWTWAALFLVAWWVMLALLIMRRRKGSRAGGVLGPAAVVPGVVALLCGGMLAGQLVTEQALTLAVVVGEDARLREGRHVDVSGDALPEGLEVRVLERAPDGWVKVTLPGDLRSGWMQSEDVETL